MEMLCIECVQRSKKPIRSMESLCILKKRPGTEFVCVFVFRGGGDEIFVVKIASLDLHQVDVT